MEGLAQQMAGQTPGGMGQMPTVEEVIQLLMEGVDPQALMEAGIPQELIMQAMQVLEQQMAQQAPQQMSVGEAGLAQAMAR